MRYDISVGRTLGYGTLGTRYVRSRQDELRKEQKMDDRRRPEAGPASHAATLSVVEAEIERAGALPRGVSGAPTAVS
jgi:hypothetical protein